MTINPDFCHRCKRFLTAPEFIERWCNGCGRAPMPACQDVPARSECGNRHGLRALPTDATAMRAAGAAGFLDRIGGGDVPQAVEPLLACLTTDAAVLTDCMRAAGAPRFTGHASGQQATQLEIG
jgi:hypothetical protein